MTDLVTREDRDGIAILSLNRPDKRNALNIALWVELEAHINAIRAAGEAIGAVILRANGPTFCAGNDLKERGVELPRPNFQASIVTALATLPSLSSSRCRAVATLAGLSSRWRVTSYWRATTPSLPTRMANLRWFPSGG